MSKLKLTIPANEVVLGKQVSFVAPCDCTDIDEVIINDEAYQLVDAMGKQLTSYGDAWCSGALLSALLDTVNKRAFVLNSSVGPKRLFEAGPIVLTSEHYGTELPEPGIVGRLFFKVVE